jgi:hypothetical protein
MLDHSPVFSEGEDTGNLTKDFVALVSGGRWTMTSDRKGIERDFKFKTFKTTWVGGIRVSSAVVSMFANSQEGIHECGCEGMRREETSP